jgi:hypothetical protein
MVRENLIGYTPNPCKSQRDAKQSAAADTTRDNVRAMGTPVLAPANLSAANTSNA